MTRAIVRITPGTFEHVKLSSPPTAINRGGVLYNGVLYYGSETHLWSYEIP
jgi:hypothetical protein